MDRILNISVVIPAYNEADTIASCLTALVSQIKPGDEVIVVDNNSSDATAEIVRRYSEKQASVRLISEPQQGVQFARNRGFDEAKGDIFGRIDADTIVSAGWIEAVRAYYSLPENEKIGVASGRTGYYDLPFQGMTEFFTDMFTHGANQKLAGTHSIHGANMSLRRSTWEAIRSEVCMNFGIMEDQDLGYHVTQAGYLTGYIPTARVRASGRRMRMSPLRFWKYNRQWWMTYHNHGLYKDARKIRMTVWAANTLQAVIWVGLLFHNPRTNKFGLVRTSDKQEERAIP